MEKVLLCVLVCGYCVVFQCGSGHTISCQSNTVGVVQSSCLASNSCLADHPPGQEEMQCREMYSHVTPLPSMNFINITQCPRFRADSFRHCNLTIEPDHTVEEGQFFQANSVSSSVISLDPEHFAVNVTWNHAFRDEAINVPDSGRQLQGYEVRLVRGSTTIQCWCLWETEVSSTLLGLDYSLQYLQSSTMQVQLRTLPFGHTDNYYDTDGDIVPWPSRCNDQSVSRPIDSCPLPRYGKPRHVEVDSRLVSSGKKELLVSWSHPLRTTAPAPFLYYIYGTGDEHNFTVLANGTRHVTITDLDPTQLYMVQVQAYAGCSGLSAYISGSGQEFGCGELSDAVQEPPVPTTVATTDQTSASPPVNMTPSVNGTSKSHEHLLLPLLSTAFILMILFVVGIVVFLAAYIKLCNCSKWRSFDPPKPEVEPVYPDTKVLVLYAPSTPQEEQICIQYYVVGTLKCKFTVVSCNDHTEKSVMEWVEKETRQAHCVLIVCNRNFCSEWNSQQGGRLVNSLKTIIEYSVSDGSIDKFAKVLLDKDAKHCIPDNLYVKRMKTFVMGEDARDEDLGEVFKFVKSNHKTGFMPKIIWGKSDPSPDSTPSPSATQYLIA